MQASFSSTAHAKLNLALHITGQRPDSYHMLDSLVVFTEYGDQITVSASNTDSFTLSGAFSQILQDGDDNLVLKARDELRSFFPHEAVPVAIHLEKNLPVASGIGGGSSDAATVLSLLIRLWKIEPSSELLRQIGLRLGADVPMCLHGQIYGGGLIAKGIGEELQSLPNLPRLPIVIINDGTALSTPQIFKHLQSRDNPPLPTLTNFDSVTDICTYLKTTRNDLLAPAIRVAAQLPKILTLLRDSGALFTQMSGSGATCFGIYASLEDAQRAAAQLQLNHADWFIIATNSCPART